MDKKIKKVEIRIFLVGILFLLLIGVISGAATYCCEKTKVQKDGSGGAWCQNAPEEQCDENYRKASTSCESTVYCKKGCCYNGKEGTCMENTPQRICQEGGGLWADSPECDIPQCELGCCLIGDQAAFVTQVRCKRLSALYGLETNFLTNIKNEIECIRSITSEVEGACVFEESFERTCIRTTKKECLERKNRGENVEFYEGLLCSASELNTNCGPSTKTTCIEGKDQVYFLDTCGNIANVYDSSKINSDGTTSDPEYWSKIKDVSESCGFGNSNANSRTCGNCDYYLGSTCKEYKRGEGMNSPVYGDYICKDLGCEWGGETWNHGESWCVSDSEHRPGSRDFRLLCYDGEVIVEPCADFRGEICIESSIPSEVTGTEEFSVAACKVNRWQDCINQDNKKDCENEDIRDCKWLSKSQDLNLFMKNSDAEGICVPKYPPGFDFYKDDKGDAESICNLADKRCVVKYVRRYEGSEHHVIIDIERMITALNDIFFQAGTYGREWKAEKNEECEKEEWKEQASLLCSSLGDCGSSLNFLDVKGYYNLDDLYKWGERLDKEEVEDALKQ